MELTRKRLKLSSIVVLVFAGVHLIQIISELMFGEINNAIIPEGAPDNILLITKIILLSVSILLLLPQIYIGIKGIKIAKNPTAAKGHIVWAIILFVFAVLGLVEPIVNIINRGGLYDNGTTIFSFLLEVMVYFDYIKYAIAVSKDFSAK